MVEQQQERSPTLAALAALFWLGIATWIVSVALLLVNCLRDASPLPFFEIFDNPLASAPAVVFWTSTTMVFVITARQTAYLRAARRTEVRGRRLAITAFFIAQGVWIAAYVTLLVINVLTHHFAAAAVFGAVGTGLFTVLKLTETRTHQQQERSPTLATLAALSLAGWLALYGLLFWYFPLYQSSCTSEMCGYALLGPLYLIGGTGALLGVAAWLGATVRAVRRREGLSALSIGLLLPVALGTTFNVFFVGHQAYGAFGYAGLLALFSVVAATLLATSVTQRQTVRRRVAVAGLVLAVALLVASSLVG